ncbi:MAG: hypothetical protein K8S15_02620 [Candidatus Aegiribacteria sp.]|nr:hypothetical protein [Candidatus Aegiribacteria sp.]
MRIRTGTLPWITLFVLVTAAGAVGVRAPRLIPVYPWETEYSTDLLVSPGVSWRLVNSFRNHFICWRLFHGTIPVSTQGCSPLEDMNLRSMEWKLRDTWTAMNRNNCMRTTRDQGSLVPTIYLPLDMPPILAGAIGEGGQIDISGYQKITLSGVSHYRPNAVQMEGESQSLFPDLKMEQELRVQLEGTIGEKIHVDVDHDSRRSFGPQSSLSLRYEGYEDEIIQSIEMGDISLSITGPEFVSYSIPHQGLFGAKILAQVGPVEFTTIASRQAGSTESSEFVGQAIMVEDSILDIHPADNYFFYTLPDSQQQPQIVSIRVFQDDLDGTNNQETGAVEGAWFIEGTGETGNGYWDELQPGLDLDYVLVDSSTTIRFRRPVNNNYRIAVWMVTAEGDTIGNASTGTDWNLKLIKQSNPLPDYSTWSYELRNRYFLGANNIVRESFNCSIYLDRSGEDPVQSQEGVPFIELLGLDTNGDGSLADEENAVDWDNGFLVFPETRPFTDPVLNVTNPAVYNENNPLPTQSKYFIEVSYRAASTTYSLGRMGIIPGSESVTLSVAGTTRTLAKDVDYTIIYEIGLLTLMGEAAEDAQNPSNTLRVTFEYLPLFAAQKKTLIGSRAVYSIGSDSWLGATVMFESASTPGDRPRVSEESTRTLVADIDAHLETKPEFLTDFANMIPGITTEAESKAIISGEIAMSFPNPNVDGIAYVDDMEGTETAFPVGQSRAAWHLSSIPVTQVSPEFPVGEIRWYNTYRRWKLEDIVPNVTGRQEDNYVNNILELYFQPKDDSEYSWGGIQRCMDKYGLDFSRKTHLRMYIRVTGSAQSGNICLDLGERIDEDSYWLERTAGELVRRANGELDTEDINTDGILSNDEDTGLDNLWDDEENPPEGGDPNMDNYHYDGNEPPSERYDRINGTQNNDLLDTEDLNRNGILDRSNSFFRIHIPIDDPDYIVSGPNANGWMLIEIPLEDTSVVSVPGFVTGTPTWEKISYARLWVDGFADADTVQIYDLEVVGNRWEEKGVLLADSIGLPVLKSEKMYVSTVNNKDNPEYANDPPPGVDTGKDEYGDPRLEQSISLEAENICSGHYGLATQSFYSGEDYTGYKQIRFLVHGEELYDSDLIYRLGTDSLNYYEIGVDLKPGWQIVEISLDDLVGLKAVKDQLELEYIKEGNLAVRGSPNFAKIMEMSLGLQNNSATPLNTTVWVDDITLNQPWSNSGTAHRVTMGLDVADFLSLSGDYREVDSDFHGLGSRSGQGNTKTTYNAGATMYINRFTPPLWALYAPANFAWSLNISKPVFQSGSDFRLSDDESWDERTQSRGWSTGFQLRKNSSSESFFSRYLIDPFRFTHTYSRGYGLTPSSRDTSSMADGALSYEISPGRMQLLDLPVIEYFRIRPTRVSWSLSRRNNWDTRWSFVNDDTVQTRATILRTLSSNGAITFNPWKGLSASGSLGLVRDLLYPWEGSTGMNVGREISRNQSISVSQDINLFDYLNPRFSFDSHYGQSRLAPHTLSGADSLGLQRYSVSATRRVNVRIGFVHTIRSLARLRDERLDEEAETGSPRWFLIKLERWANMINDPNITYSETEGSEYRDMEFIPDWRYQTGIEPVLDDVVPWDRTKGWNLQVSGGFRPVSTMSFRIEYRSSENRNLYSGFWNNQRSKTWPSVSFSWSGLHRIAGLSDIIRTGSASSGYSIETTESGRYESDVYIPTTETKKVNWSPLFNISFTLLNDVQISLSDNVTNTVMQSFTGTQAKTESSNSSLQFRIQYSFCAPGGIAIPLPLLDRLRISFRSDLTTSLNVTRSRTRSELLGSSVGAQLQTDREEWRIEPAVNYDFGTVTAGLTGIIGWKTDRVNSQFDQRDIGMNIWVTINF